MPETFERRLDIRHRRDIVGRRFFRQTFRHVARRAALLVTDITAAAVAVWVTFAVGYALGVADLARATEVMPLFVLLAVFGQAAMRTYEAGARWRSYGNVANGYLSAAAAAIGLTLAYNEHWIGIPPLLLMAVVGSAISVLSRYVLARTALAVHQLGYAVKQGVIIGPEEDATELHERLRTAENWNYRVLTGANWDLTRPGSIEKLATFISEHDIQAVVLTAQLDKRRFRHLVQSAFLHGAGVSIVPATLVDLGCSIGSSEAGGIPLLQLEVPGLHVAQMLIKRSLDLVIASFALVVLSPLLAGIALAIRLESRGPVFFRQRRPGLGGRLFPMLKFRTMRADAEEILKRDPALYRYFMENDCKLPDGEDPRISRVGRFLRRTSLDELPQLFNVVAGHMSLVGPRPVVGPEMTYYGVWAPVVQGVRPGMTGLWQIMGRSRVAFPKRAEIDVDYVKQWSIWLDLKILALTVPAVVRAHGAH